MKTHASKAPPNIRKRIFSWLEPQADNLADRLLPGEQWIRAISVAYAHGFRFDPTDVETPRLDEMAALDAAGDFIGRNLFHAKHAREIAVEERALQKARSLQKWAQSPSNEELAEQNRIAREKAEQEAELERRAREMLALEEQKRLEKFRAQIKKEMK
jgi:hypothetical protein